MFYIVLVKSTAELLHFDEVILNGANFLHCQHALHDGDVGVNLIVASFFLGYESVGSAGEAGGDIIGALGEVGCNKIEMMGRSGVEAERHGYVTYDLKCVGHTIRQFESIACANDVNDIEIDRHGKGLLA